VNQFGLQYAGGKEMLAAKNRIVMSKNAFTVRFDDAQASALEKYGKLILFGYKQFIKVQRYGW